MRTEDQEGTFNVSIPSDPEEIRRVQDDIETALRRNGFEDKEIFGIRLALEEALVNALKHGNQMDRAKQIHVRYSVSPDRFDIAITDEGPGFDMDDVPDPLDEENLERPCGRGLFLIRHYMTDVTYHPPGNHVTMSKVRQTAGASNNGSH